MTQIRIYILILIFIQLSSCKEDPGIPSVQTVDVYNKTQKSASCKGKITNIYNVDIDSYGVCWSTQPKPTVQNNNSYAKQNVVGNFNVEILGLQPYTKYYARVFARNDNGVFYGEEIAFTTQPPNGTIVKDIDGNIYHTIIIGTQAWLVENLKTTRFQNGDLISYLDPQHNDSSSYCYYDNNIDLYRIYGCLYNLNAINDKRRICPEGWRIPTEEEWSILSNYSKTDNKLKEVGSEHWIKNNQSATNETGFTALPGGEYSFTFKRFGFIGREGSWWSSEGTKRFSITDYSGIGFINLFEGDFFSIRCIQN